jgi:hypothetical protein
MGRVTQNFDFVAIVVLALVLGVVQAPKWHVRMIDMEQPGSEFRILHVDPVVRTIPFLR